MPTYLVTRHEGTRLWASAMSKHGRLPFTIDHMVDHLDPETLKKGDVVVGTLPIHLAADLHAKGIEFWALDLHLPPNARGKELLGVELYKKLGAHFTRYEIRRKGSTEVTARGKGAATKPQPSISVIPVSDALAPAAIGWLHRPTEQVCLLASKDMKSKAKVLQAWLRSRETPPNVVVVDWDDRDFPTLLAQAEDLAGDLAKDNRPLVSVNLTGGTKPMAMALQRAFGKRSQSFGSSLSGSYVDTAHRRIDELLAQAPTVTQMQSVLNIADLLALQGFKVASAQSGDSNYPQLLARIDLFDAYMSRESGAWLSAWYDLLSGADWLVSWRNNKKQRELIKTYKKDNSIKPYYKVSIKGSHKNPEFHFSVLDPSKLKWEPLREALRSDFGKVLLQSGAIAELSVDEDNLSLKMGGRRLDELAFLMGGWMEVWLAAQFRRAGVSDWAQGVRVTKDRVDNELDLIAATGNNLLLVEVKTGSLNYVGMDDNKAKETVYKLDSIAEKLGRHFNERWLVSLKPVAAEDRDRAKAFGIRVFADGDLQQLPNAILEWRTAKALEQHAQYHRSTFDAPKQK